MNIFDCILIMWVSLRPVCARTLLTYENVSGGVWPNENIGHTKSFHLLTDDYGNKNAVLESVLDANLA